VLAQDEARMLNHDWTGTGHLLLGLTGEGGGVAARALESLGISLDTVRQQVEEIIGQGEQAPPGHVPFTPRAKKVLELAFREARALDHGYIGTEHILLGLIREGDGVAAQVLVRLGADLNRAREQVRQLLQAGQGDDDVLTGAPCLLRADDYAGIWRDKPVAGLLGRSPVCVTPAADVAGAPEVPSFTALMSVTPQRGPVPVTRARRLPGTRSPSTGPCAASAGQ
jgi:hypothetical protein